MTNVDKARIMIRQTHGDAADSAIAAVCHIPIQQVREMRKEAGK